MVTKDIFLWTIAVSAATAIIESLIPNTSYILFVSSVNPVGPGDASRVEFRTYEPSLFILFFYFYLADLWLPHVSEWDVKALFNRSTIYIATLPEGAPWQFRLGCKHDTLRLLRNLVCQLASQLGAETFHVLTETLTNLDCLIVTCKLYCYHHQYQQNH